MAGVERACKICMTMGVFGAWGDVFFRCFLVLLHCLYLSDLRIPLGLSASEIIDLVQ